MPVILRDLGGEATHYVLTVAEYKALLNHGAPPKAGTKHLPNDVSILINGGVTLLAAWRIHRGFSQEQVAQFLEVVQATVSKFESHRPGKSAGARYFGKLALLYNTSIENLRH